MPYLCYVNYITCCSNLNYLIVYCFQGVDLRQYSKNVEEELLAVENKSIHSCILNTYNTVVNNSEELVVITS